MPTIGIVAGEASGDLIASQLIATLKQKLPDIKFIGIAGPKMLAEGAETLFPMERLAVRGYVEVLRHYFGILKIRRALLKYFLKNPPDLFISIDAPDFNFGLSRLLKQHGIKTIHYVSPSIWAWRRGRIHSIAKSTDEILCLFPFEKPLYDEAGIAATYVGHPLADMIAPKQNKTQMRKELQLGKEGLVIALLPGSRQGELGYMADLFIHAAQQIAHDVPETQFLVPLISRETRAKFEEAIRRNHAEDLSFKLLFGHAHMALAAADGSIVASGTATLEAALLQCPMVIAYRMSRLSWMVMKHMRYLPWAGLPNILANQDLVPELIQEQATPQALAESLLTLVYDRDRVKTLQTEFKKIHLSLRQNASEKAAEAVLKRLAL
jgi:lipid-A-disaccharide synthase